MKTIHDYIKEYGKYSFLEKEFNEVDNIIFSMLSYIDFYNIVPMHNEGSIYLKDAAKLVFKKHDKKEINKQIIAVKESTNLLSELAETKRYRNLELLNYEYIVSFDTQFGALCIKLPNKMMYVSFEGTDEFLSGWEEDFRLSYEFPIKAQSLAIDYLNKVVSKNPFSPKIYVGGHSKGGNLALVASMYCKHRVYRKIKWVYSNDGPGLLKNILETNRYKRVAFKFSHIIPEQSMIGMLFESNEDKYVVVKSSKKKYMQHNCATWLVKNNEFEKTELSDYSKNFHESIIAWLNKLNPSQRKEFTTILFSLFKKAEIDDLVELKSTKVTNMIKLLKEMKNISKENREMLLSTFKALYNELKN